MSIKQKLRFFTNIWPFVATKIKTVQNFVHITGYFWCTIMLVPKYFDVDIENQLMAQKTLFLYKQSVKLGELGHSMYRLTTDPTVLLNV